jgi:hypothetical protein
MDFELEDNGDGGDLILTVNDVKFISGFQNMPYLGLVGGNVEASTRVRLESEQAFDYWANSLLMNNESVIQFNSETERLLLVTALNSDGRLKILEAVKKDLSFMKQFSDLTVSVSIPKVDFVEIKLKINELNNQSSTEFVYIWDSIKRELSVNK